MDVAGRDGATCVRTGESGSVKRTEDVEVRPGTRMRSVVCETEVIVVVAPEKHVLLACGGQLMEFIARGSSDSAGGPSSPIDPALAAGTLLGERYVAENSTVELLCTKPGAGTLTADGSPLKVKDSKALPSSD
jgi:hypothetical protein